MSIAPCNWKFVVIDTGIWPNMRVGCFVRRNESIQCVSIFREADKETPVRTVIYYSHSMQLRWARQDRGFSVWHIDGVQPYNLLTFNPVERDSPYSPVFFLGVEKPLPFRYGTPSFDSQCAPGTPLLTSTLELWGFVNEEGKASSLHEQTGTCSDFE